MNKKSAILQSALLIAALAFGSCSASAWAADSCPSCGASNASAAMAAGSGVLVMGSVETVAASGMVVVGSVEAVGDGVILVLKGASEGVTASVKVSKEAGKELSLAAGAVVDVIAVSTGHLLIVAGKAIAFIPNEIGVALIHQSKVH